MRVGRSDEVELSVEEMGVSWEHAEFRFRDGDYWVIDSGSTNGTYVNDERIEKKALRPGDRVRFATAEFEVEFLDAGEARQTMVM